MTGITNNTDNQKLICVCMWDHDGIRVVLVTDAEVFYMEVCLTDKLPCEGHDSKMMGEQKNELA